MYVIWAVQHAAQAHNTHGLEYVLVGQMYSYDAPVLINKGGQH